MTTEELTRRASKVADKYDLESWDDNWSPTMDGGPKKYMIVGANIGPWEDEFWARFVDTQDAVVTEIERSIHDDTCDVEGIYDLESSDYMTPLSYKYQVVIDWPKD